MILDTSFVIDLMNKEEGAIKKLDELTRRGETQLITCVSVFELFTGVKMSERIEEERDKVIGALEGQLIIGLDKAAAEKGGEINGELKSEGGGINSLDCMIAGIALVKGERVLTRNIKDFGKISRLRVETY